MKFQCVICGCIDDTAYAPVAADAKYFDWSYAPARNGRRICTACGPSRYSDGSHSEYGRWHGKFDREFVPRGKFISLTIAPKCNKIQTQRATFTSVGGVVTVTLRDGRTGSAGHSGTWAPGGHCTVGLVRIGVNSLNVLRLAGSYEKLYRLKYAKRIIDEAKPWHLLVVTE